MSGWEAGRNNLKEQYSIMGLTVDVCPSGDEAAKRLEYEVYLHEGYIEANGRGLVLENLDYPEYVHFVAREGGKTVGSLRLVTDPKPRHGIFRLNAFNHFSLRAWARDLMAGADPRSVVEVGTMVIHPEYRGGDAYMQLFSKSFEFALLKRFRYAVSTIDAAFYNRLRKRGVPFQEMGESRHYMGSETVPALIDIDQLARLLLGRHTAAGAASSSALKPAMAS